MSIVDIVVIILILLGAAVGFKRGFTRQLVECIGFIVCLVLAYLLKNPVSSFLYEYLPFFTFGGVVKGVIVLNILVYEVLAFLIVFSILKIALSLVKMLTGAFEGLLNATIILGIPSKILGAILGGIEWTIISFITIFVLSLPIFNNNFINDSVICKDILTYTPILSPITSKTVTVFNEFSSLKDKYQDNTNVNQFNLDALDLFLKYDIIDIDSANKLYSSGKFNTITNVDTVLDKYKGV